MAALAAISASPRLNAPPENSAFVTKSAQIAFIAPSVFGPLRTKIALSLVYLISAIKISN